MVLDSMVGTSLPTIEEQPEVADGLGPECMQTNYTENGLKNTFFCPPFDANPPPTNFYERMY